MDTGPVTRATVSEDKDAQAFVNLRNDEVAAEARRLYSEVDAYQHRLISNYYQRHHWYAPMYGDQWPEDAAIRPGKIHITANIVKPAVDVSGRLEGMLPRVALIPDGLDDYDRKRAEVSQKIHMRLLEASDWGDWLQTLTKTKALYGKGIMKVFWNKVDGRPDVKVLENPANLRLGYGSSDFMVLDWAIYESSISPIEAMRRFPDITVVPNKDDASLLVIRASDHSDPLDQIPIDSESTVSIVQLHRPVPYLPSDYERKQVRHWDFWYRDEKSVVHNAQLINGVLAKDIAIHKELLDIPYIVVEHDHEPGTPEGMSMVDEIRDLQIEWNRALSHWAQLIADEIDPAWQITGENADSVPDGVIPRGGEVIAAGAGNKIEPIVKPVNQMPVQTLMAEFWQTYNRITGLSEIQFGQANGTQTTGRSLAVQVEAALNRIDPRRQLLYRGLKRLLVFWTHMLVVQNPKIEFEGLDTEAETHRIGPVVEGLTRWRITAPEPTPKDAIENTTNELNKVNGKLSSLKTAMHQLGIDDPDAEIALIEEERSNAHVFPGEVQSFLASVTQLANLQQILSGLGVNPQAFFGGTSLANLGQGVAQNQAQQATPAVNPDQNQPGPASQPGTPPTPGGPAMGQLQNRDQLNATPGGGIADHSQVRFVQNIAGGTAQPGQA